MIPHYVRTPVTAKAEREALAVELLNRDLVSTRWGTLLLQGESWGPGGGPRTYYPQWHTNATRSAPPTLPDVEDTRRSRVANRVARWLLSLEGGYK